MKKTIFIKTLFFFISLSFGVIWTLVFFTPLYSQENFLDSSFTEEEINPNNQTEEENFEANNMTSEKENYSELQETTISLPPQTTFNLNIANLLMYHHINKNIPYDPERSLYFSPIENLLQVNTQLKYIFLNRKISFNFDSSVYLQLEKYDSSRSAIFSDQEYILNGLNLILNFNSYLSLEIGKIDIDGGVGFLISPTDFMKTQTRFRDGNVYYPNRRIGAYLIKFDSFFGPWIWSVAYVPMFKTIYKEFERTYLDKNPFFGELWSRLSLQTDNLQINFIFYWNGYAQGGINLTTTLGEEVVLYFDGAGKVSTWPVVTTKENFFLPTEKQYDITKEHNYRGQAVLGITYTPASILTLLAEVYGNVGGENQYWSKYREKISSINSTAQRLENDSDSRINALASQYRGESQSALTLHNPLALQPLFITIGLSRDDAFSMFTTHVINLSTRIIYSPIDTGFLWSNNLVWQLPAVVNLGIFSSWYFGLKDGVFTSTSKTFTIGLATHFYF